LYLTDRNNPRLRGIAMAISLKHPETRDIKIISAGSAFASFLLGPAYFAFKGIWLHFLLYLLLMVFTAGIVWFIYPFFTTGILLKHYLHRGYEYM